MDSKFNQQLGQLSETAGGKPPGKHCIIENLERDAQGDVIHAQRSLLAT